MRTHMHVFLAIAVLALPALAQTYTVPSSNSSSQRRGAYAATVQPTSIMIDPLFGGGDKQTVFVVPAKRSRPEDLGPIVQDLQVMCRIFDKKVDPSALAAFAARAPESTLVGALFSRQSGAQTEALYLEDYGVVFFIKVAFPLDFSEPEQKPEAQGQLGADPLWQSVREETLYGNRTSAQPNDPERAEAMNREATCILTTTLVQALKHAANIQALEPSEKIIIRATGRNQPDSRPPHLRGRRRGTGYNGGAYDMYGGTDSLSTATSSRPTTLIVRTTKADVDDYSGGRLTFEQFEANAIVIGLESTSENALPAPAPAPHTPY